MTALALGWPMTNLQEFSPMEGDVYTGQIEHRGWTYKTRVQYVAEIVSANKCESLPKRTDPSRVQSLLYVSTPVSLLTAGYKSSDVRLSTAW